MTTTPINSVWVLASPDTAVRIDGNKSLGALFVDAPLESRALRDIRLTRMRYIDPKITPLPRWEQLDLPSMSALRSSTPSLSSACKLLDSASVLNHDTETSLVSLCQRWSINDTDAVALLQTIIESPRYVKNRRSLAIAIQVILPFTINLSRVLAKAQNVTHNNARQQIFHLRQKGLLPQHHN
jgi:hypothetical protein